MSRDRAHAGTLPPLDAPRLVGELNRILPRLADHVARLQRLSVRTVTAATTLTEADNVLLADTTAGGFTVTLPAAEGARNRLYTVKKTVAANTVTLDGAGAETIDGAATLAWATQWGARSVLSDGTAWYVVATV